jgi:hypothetical protein
MKAVQCEQDFSRVQHPVASCIARLAPIRAGRSRYVRAFNGSRGLGLGRVHFGWGHHRLSLATLSGRKKHDC